MHEISYTLVYVVVVSSYHTTPVVLSVLSILSSTPHFGADSSSSIGELDELDFWGGE